MGAATQVTGAQARTIIRAGQWRGPTAGLAPGYVQANLVILPQEHAFHFLAYCGRNPKPCPLLDVLEPGSTEPSIAGGADLRTDVPLYRVYRDGLHAGDTGDIRGLWRDEYASFLLGCSYTFEAALVRAGVPVRHWEAGTNVPMYITSIPTVAAGPFAGPMVVSMRPVPGRLVARAVQVTSRYPLAHGAPVHVGSPADIGVADLAHPDFGDPPRLHAADVPVFWACGVTSQVALARSGLPFFIGHSPGYMFVTDLRDEDLALA